jgi:hypothetical protein
MVFGASQVSRTIEGETKLGASGCDGLINKDFMKRRISLTAVAVFFFLGGLFGVMTELMQGKGLAIPSYYLLNMVAAFGLLRLWRYARAYALFAVGCALASALVGVFVVAGSPQLADGTFLFFGQATNKTMTVGMVLMMFVAYIALFIWMLWVLTRREVRELFKPRSVLTV